MEINCHGGVFVVRKILETVLKNGARAAEPGEFTKRAFLNGRMDLSRAEAVIDVIHSKNEFALKNSVSQLRGSIQRKYRLCEMKSSITLPILSRRWMIRSIFLLMGMQRALWKKQKNC